MIGIRFISCKNLIRSFPIEADYPGSKSDKIGTKEIFWRSYLNCLNCLRIISYRGFLWTHPLKVSNVI